MNFNVSQLGYYLVNNAGIFCCVCIGLVLILSLLMKNSETGGKVLLISLIAFAAWYIYTHFIV